MANWYDDEAFWADTGPVIFTEERFSQTAAEVDHIVELLKLKPGSALLDLACGVGRHSLEFAQRGFRVTGVDRTAQYLDQARTSTTERKLDVEWVLDDMRRFRRDGAFDVAVNLLTSFGYFTDRADDRRVVENLHASLKPGGCLIMEMMGKEVLARIFQERDWNELPDGALVLQERTLSDDWSWIDVRWIILRGSERAEQRFGMRLFSAIELRSLLEDAGFTDVVTYGSFEGTPYDQKAERMIVVARR